MAEDRPTAAAACIIAALVLMSVCGSACSRRIEVTEVKLTRGDPANGKTAIRRYGCPTCHKIPGVREAGGVVGPPLAGVGTRAFIAGILPNTPQNMIDWIRHPQKIDSRKAMPDMNVTETDARDIAAYLYTLGTTTPIR